MMHNLGNLKTTYEKLHFLFVVSNDSIKTELKKLICNFKNQHSIHVANSYSSNKLRSYCTKATTPYVYFHDCDDWADYELLNNIFNECRIGDSIYCFNVTKHHYDEHGRICANDKLIFKIPQGPITNIANIPTCVYSKIIPTKYLYEIDFPNLPYTQDWAISYQLYPIVKHIFDNRTSYHYNNYPTSSSHYSHDTNYGIKRVAAYSRIICKKMNSVGLTYEADFLKVKYNIDLCNRFRMIGKYIAPKMPTRRLICKMNNKSRISIAYHTLINITHFIIRH